MGDGMSLSISITLVHSPAPRQVIEIGLVVAEGCTVAQALQRVELASQWSTTGAQQVSFGVWGRKVGLAHVLNDQDRLEIYRVLTVDPKVARRERFVRQGAKKAAGLFAKRRVGAKPGY